ncbi:MAG: hypothetical protein QXI91_01965 [Candidatus Bathyarchaeia archaeon]
MRYTVRALGLIIVFLWIITLSFPVTVAFSLMKLLEAKNMGIQEPKVAFSNGNFTFFMPFYINNTGFYEISDVNVKVQINRKNSTFSTVSVQLPNVPAGTLANSSCNFSLSLEELVLKDSELLTNDAELDVNASLHLRIAHAIAFTVSMGFTTHWGAPFNNLTIYNIAYNNQTSVFSFSVSFENHAFYPLNGTFTAELYNSANALVGSATQYVNVQPEEMFQTSFTLTIGDHSKMTSEGVLRLYFVNVQISEEMWMFP